MLPGEQNVLKVLNLLTMLSRSRQQFFNHFTEEEKATLTISKQLIFDSGLTVPEFTNAVHEISEKGYIWHMVIYDENIRSQINEILKPDVYDAVMNEIRKLDTDENSKKLNQSALDLFKKVAPHDVQIKPGNSIDEPVKISELFEDGLHEINKLRPDEIATIILMPFRDINRLLDEMNNGKNFSEIQDDGFWYDKNNLKFHIDGQLIPTSYQGKPNLEHFVLSDFFSNTTASKVEYDEIIGLDMSKGNESYRDAMRKFIKKHPKLAAIFSVHEYHTEFHPERY